MSKWITPPALRPADTVAIMSPAGAVREEFVRGAEDMLLSKGYRVRVMPHALGRCGTYSGTAGERVADFTDAWLDESVKAVICSRGGYGAVALLDALDHLPLERHPKWLLGFSDTSALHALMAKHGLHSLHGPMAKYLKDEGANLEATLDMLAGSPTALEWGGTTPNTPGTITGRIVGGNMAVLSALMGTPYDIYSHGDILVIEDINEPIYKVERMLWQLHFAGVLDRAKGIIVGDFCDWEADRNFESMQSMIQEFFSGRGLPIAFDAPIGHAGRCIPWIEGASVEVEIKEYSASIRYLG